MLTKAMRQYVMNETKNGYTKEKQNAYNYRLKNYAAQALKDLALLAEKLPENQQAEIFNKDNMYGLLKALFKLDSKLWEDKELLKKKRRRLLPLCYDIIMLLNDYTFAALIAPLQWDITKQEGRHLNGLRAVYYRSLISPEEEERKLRE